MINLWLHFVKMPPGPIKKLSRFKIICKFEAVILPQSNFFAVKSNFFSVTDSFLFLRLLCIEFVTRHLVQSIVLYC